MRVTCLLMLGVVAAAAAAGQNFSPVGRAAAERYAAKQPKAEVYNGPRTKLSMWIWSDKYTYQPGESLTLKWTVKTNGDLYPYTVFVYRQNNQTGKKTYLPGGGEEATDINGNTAAQGFQPVQLADASKAVLVGSGGKFPAVAIPSELWHAHVGGAAARLHRHRCPENLLHEDRRGQGCYHHLERNHRRPHADQ